MQGVPWPQLFRHHVAESLWHHLVFPPCLCPQHSCYRNLKAHLPLPSHKSSLCLECVIPHSGVFLLLLSVKISIPSLPFPHPSILSREIVTCFYYSLSWSLFASLIALMCCILRIWASFHQFFPFIDKDIYCQRVWKGLEVAHLTHRWCLSYDCDI